MSTFPELSNTRLSSTPLSGSWAGASLPDELGGDFQSLFQGLLGGGFPSQSLGGSDPELGSFSADAFLTPVLMGLYSQLSGAASKSGVPSQWRRFPSSNPGVERNGYGYGLEDGWTWGMDQPAFSVPSGDPVQGRISQGVHAGHRAMDYAVPVGTPVASTLSGRVKKAGWDPDGYGKYLVVENERYQVYFAHLSEFKVDQGDVVQPGQILGRSGSTGNSTGPHLHYEIREDDRAVDPRPLIESGPRAERG